MLPEYCFPQRKTVRFWKQSLINVRGKISGHLILSRQMEATAHTYRSSEQMGLCVGAGKLCNSGNLGIVYTDAVSNRNGFMTWKPHRKRHGFKEFTRNLSNR